VTGFDAVPVAEHFAKEGTRAGGELVVSGGLLESGKDFVLGEGAWGDSGANGVEVHGLVFVREIRGYEF
jgi:hypothetical protein